jgi:hypothetical protein
MSFCRESLGAETMSTQRSRKLLWACIDHATGFILSDGEAINALMWATLLPRQLHAREHTPMI